MPYFADIDDPKDLIDQFLHRFNKETATLASIYRQGVDDESIKTLNSWKRDLQDKIFLISGTINALRSNLFSMQMIKKYPQLQTMGDYLGLLMMASMSMVNHNPETGFTKIVEEVQLVRRYCDILLTKLTQSY